MLPFRSCVPSIISQRGCVRGSLTGQNRIQSYTYSFLNITEITTSVWTMELVTFTKTCRILIVVLNICQYSLETHCHLEACMKALKGRDGHKRAFSDFLACRWKFGYKPSHPSQLKEASIADLRPSWFHTKKWSSLTYSLERRLSKGPWIGGYTQGAVALRKRKN